MPGTSFNVGDLAGDIASLNAHIVTHSLTAAINITTSGSNNFINAKKNGNTLFVDYAIYTGASINANTKIATVSGVTLEQSIHAAVILDDGGNTRIMMNTSGEIYVEKAVANGKWIAGSLVGLIA